MNKYVVSHAVQELKEIPYHWRMQDYEIEDKIKELRKQIYELQNSRKKQPKLLTFEGEEKVEKVRIFDGWNIMGEDGEKKGLFCADHWHIPNEREVEEIIKEFDLKKEVQEILKKQIK